MPLDVLGRTRATLMHATSFELFGSLLTSNQPPWPRGPGTLVNLHRDGARSLQLWIFNEECLVGVGHQPASITSLPFVHTARRFYRLDAAVKTWD